MHTAILCRKHLKFALFLFLIFPALQVRSQVVPLYNAFAHNDYWHKRPLYDALENGYLHLEADVYLRNNRLIVAHILPVLRKKHTLEEMYFKPLLSCIRGTTNQSFCPDLPLTLMIDIKSDAEKTYLLLEPLLQKYTEILSSYEDGKIIRRQVTIVLSGHKPSYLLKQRVNRLAFIDDDLLRANQDTLSSDIYQTASCKYSRLLTWNGKGEMPARERKRLSAYVNAAHLSGKKVRLWASPENKTVWKELLACGVDLINTNKLVALRNFLISENSSFVYQK